MRYVKFSIAIKPYVKKYIEVKYPQPIKLSTKTTIGHILFSILEKHTNPFKESKDILYIRYQLLSDRIIMLLPTNAAHIHHNEFKASEPKSILINNFFEKKIREELFSFCDLHSTLKLTQRQAIEVFCKNYNIQLGIDIKFDAMRQAEFRYRKSFKKSITEMSHK